MIEIEQTIYNLKPNKNFTQIAISKDVLGYRYYIQVNEKWGLSNYVVFKDYILGVFGYLLEKENIDKNVSYFTSFEECVEDIKKLTPAKINKYFKKAPQNKILIAEKK